MIKAKDDNHIIIDWKDYPYINPNYPFRGFKARNEANEIKCTCGWRVTNIFTSLTFADSANTELDISDIAIAVTHYKAYQKHFGFTNEEMRKKFPNLHTVVWKAYDTAKKQQPENLMKQLSLFKNPKVEEPEMVKVKDENGNIIIKPIYDVPEIKKPKPKKEFLSEEAERLAKIDVSKYRIEVEGLGGYNPKTDYYEHIYEVPKSENSSDIIAAIIDAERPIPEVGEPIGLTISGYKDGKHFVEVPKMTQKMVEDGIKTHLDWQLYLQRHFTGDKLRFKICEGYVEVLDLEKEQVPPRRK